MSSERKSERGQRERWDGKSGVRHGPQRRSMRPQMSLKETCMLQRPFKKKLCTITTTATTAGRSRAVESEGKREDEGRRLGNRPGYINPSRVTKPRPIQIRFRPSLACAATSCHLPLLLHIHSESEGVLVKGTAFKGVPSQRKRKQSVFSVAQNVHL